MTDQDISQQQADILAKLPANLAVMKMEMDNIQALALSHPRDHEQIKADLTKQFETYPLLALEAIYSKPVGQQDDGQQKMVRNLSVRAAEAIYEAYPNCAVRVDTHILDDDHVKLEAIFTDYQYGRIWKAAKIVSKFYKKRGSTTMVKWADDRFFDVVVPANGSKLIREVILRSVSPGLRAYLFEMAERVTSKLLNKDQLDNILRKFAAKGVKLEMLEAYLGRTVGEGWTTQDSLDLIGVWNAIDQGESTIEEVFGPKKPANQPPPPTNGNGGGGVSGNDLANATVVPPPGQQADAPAAPAEETVNTETGVVSPPASEPAISAGQLEEISRRSQALTEPGQMEFFRLVKAYGAEKASQLTESQAKDLLSWLMSADWEEKSLKELYRKAGATERNQQMEWLQLFADENLDNKVMASEYELPDRKAYSAWLDEKGKALA